MLHFKNITTIKESDFIHNLYFNTKEPDAPRKIFSEEKEDVQFIIFNRHKKAANLVFHKNIIIGFIIITEVTGGINIGGALISEKRGKGFGTKIFSKKVKELIEIYPTKNIYASARKDNIAAIKSIENAGFVYQDDELKPSIPGVCEEIIYKNFIYKSKV